MVSPIAALLNVHRHELTLIPGKAIAKNIKQKQSQIQKLCGSATLACPLPTPLSCRFFILGEPQNKKDAPKFGRGSKKIHSGFRLPILPELGEGAGG
jgi:hypothetical protein